MTLKTTVGSPSADRNGPFSPSAAVVYGDKAGDAALIVAMFAILLLLTTVGLLVAILRNEIEDLYTADVLNPEEA